MSGVLLPHLNPFPAAFAISRGGRLFMLHPWDR
jgi:hypothetical protein